MKNLSIALFLLIAISCGKKEEYLEYKVIGQQRPNTLACKYSLSAGPDHPVMEIWDECGKYKHNQVVFKVLK